MNALINTIETPKDCAFRTFLDTVPNDIFYTITADLVGMQLKAFGKCVKFDFDNLESVITAIGLSDNGDTYFSNVVKHYGLDADCCEHDLNITDYSGASADFKKFLGDCVRYISNYFRAVGGLNYYQNFVSDLNRTIEGNSQQTASCSPQDALIYALLDLIIYAFILKRGTDYYEGDQDLDNRLKSVDSNAGMTYYIPALDDMEEIHANILANC